MSPQPLLVHWLPSVLVFLKRAADDQHLQVGALDGEKGGAQQLPVIRRR